MGQRKYIEWRTEFKEATPANNNHRPRGVRLLQGDDDYDAEEIELHLIDDTGAEVRVLIDGQFPYRIGYGLFMPERLSITQHHNGACWEDSVDVPIQHLSQRIADAIQDTVEKALFTHIEREVAIGNLTGRAASEWGYQ